MDRDQNAAINIMRLGCNLWAEKPWMPPISIGGAVTESSNSESMHWDENAYEAAFGHRLK